MEPAALRKLRELLEDDQIDEAMFTLLSAGASARIEGAGAAAQGDGAQAAGEGGVAIAGNNTAPIHAGTHLHLHAGPPPPAAAQPASLRRDYLRRVWKQTDALSLLSGGDTQRPVRLGAVYTALMTDLRTDTEPARARGRLPSAAALGGDRELPLSAVAALNQHDRLVLLGGPGSGKSTFINYVAQCMAGALLGRDAEANEPNLDTLTAPLPADQWPAPAQPWRHGPLLPVLVILRDLAAQLPALGEPVGADHVWHYLCTQLQTGSLAEFAPLLRAELRDAGGLVMFDGLDEVPEAAQRREQIQQVVQDFAHSFSRCRVLVTSRTYAYQRQDWKLPGFAQAPLSPFTPGQIRAFVQAWYRHMADLMRLTPDDAAGRAALLQRQVDRNPRVAELAQRPLLLTLFARLQTEKGGQLPERREELYFAAVDLLLNDWESAKPRQRAGEKTVLEPSLTEWLRASHADVRRQLNQLAFQAHRDQQGLQGTADIRQEDLMAALLRASPQRQDVQPLQLQAYLRDRAGILVEHGVGMLQFPHRTFQEYLAACHLANDGFPEQLAQLVCPDPGRWREVTLLAAAHAARGNADLPTWALVEALCPGDLGATPSLPQAWGALLAGQVLVAAEQHIKPAPRNQGKLERLRKAQLTLLANSVLPVAERALAGRTLAALGDPRPEVMTLQGMQFVRVPAGPFWMGADDLSANERPCHSVDLAYDCLMARYPVTVAQWHEYLQHSAAQPGDGHRVDGLANEPVTGASWHDALAFCRHLTRAWLDHLPAGWQVTLPSEAEWEKAARGGAQLPQAQPAWLQLQGLRAAQASSVGLAPNPLPQRKFPWGDGFEPERANTAESGLGQTCAVGAFAAGASPYGCEDMAGQVWEWTRSLWGTDYSKHDFKFPYDPLDAKREDLAAPAGVQRLVRGGSWDNTHDLARCAWRSRVRPGFRGTLGFRVV